jgi:hypothetical protein
MSEILMPKRKLGKGRYDRKLIAEMTKLSVADNYDDAVKEWVATGNVYTDDVPDWWYAPSYCLCGHYVVYHFEVRNTLNNRMILVGSDHINTYQIIQEIKLSGIAEELITDEMINQWITERVETMKCNAWWKKNGDLFTSMFNHVKEWDLRLNVRQVGSMYSPKYGMDIPTTKIRKVSSGKIHEGNYQMASIVWRWNHPDNKRRQMDGRGYPNAKLWADLIMFNATIDAQIAKCEEEDSRLEELADKVAQADIRRRQQVKILNEKRMIELDNNLKTQCEYYAIPVFDSSDGHSDWDKNFLSDIKEKLLKKQWLSEAQVNKLRTILIGEPATPKQIALLKKLGWEGEINKREASVKISELME